MVFFTICFRTAKARDRAQPWFEGTWRKWATKNKCLMPTIVTGADFNDMLMAESSERSHFLSAVVERDQWIKGSFSSRARIMTKIQERVSHATRSVIAWQFEYPTLVYDPNEAKRAKRARRVERKGGPIRDTRPTPPATPGPSWFYWLGTQVPLFG